MGKNDARRQKQLAKKKAKREEKRSQLAKATSKDPAIRLANAAAWPFVDVLVGDTIWTNGLGSVTVSRQMPGGAIAIANFLVDVLCLGVKSSFWKVMSTFEYSEFLRKIRSSSPGSTETPEYAAKLIQTAIAFARTFGFTPDADYRHARLLLAGVDPDQCSETFTMGRDGKPYYIRGPRESLAQARSIAHRVHAAGGDYLIPVRGDADEDLGEIGHERNDERLQRSDAEGDDFEEDDVDFDLPKAPPMFASERIMRDLHAAIAERGIQTPEELQEFMAEFNKGRGRGVPQSARTSSPRAQAQDIAYDAMEAGSRAEAERLARKALDLDPDCVDALEILATATSRSPHELVAALERAVAAGERTLGPDFFAKNKGRFWGMLETRPYMRARASLASVLRQSGRTADAIGHYEAMLELNPNDNQGNRDVLLGCYLLLRDLEGARRLFAKYPESMLATFNWARVLERFLAGALDEAADARRDAIKQNRHVEANLTGRKRMPRQMPDGFSVGDESEAVVCADLLGDAWRKHADALEWLVRLSSGN